MTRAAVRDSIAGTPGAPRPSDPVTIAPPEVMTAAAHTAPRQPARLALAGALASLPLLAAAPLSAQTPDTARAAREWRCDACPEWNRPQPPFRVHGNTYYVGTRGLSALLITSDSGHVLIDGGLPESTPLIAGNVERLGFRLRDVRWILNSHSHFDHAGGIAELQRRTGAAVAASASSAAVLRSGRPGRDDPQYGELPEITPVRVARELRDGDTLRVGPLALAMHLTPGHTPGSTSWSWRSCEAGACLDLVYADSQTPVSADGFSFARSTTYPGVRRDFARGQAALERLSCDVLITPHPDASGLWERLARREAGDARALVDGNACRAYAARSRAQLAERVARDSAAAARPSR
jgi:metallo-beta-lactamase class B